MSLIVQKFGGTSVGDADRIREVAGHVARTVRRGNQVVLVVSAMGKETDELLRLAGDVARHRHGREMDMPITAGERKAIALVAMALHDQGIEAASFTGSQAGFVTDTNHQNAKILDLRTDRIQAALDAGMVPVVAGAQGVSTDKDVTFLGRGGSDTTAVALAYALKAEVCELYTDVSGVFSADPRLVPDARKMTTISFDELLEMTATGCPKPASSPAATTCPCTSDRHSPGRSAPGSRRKTTPWNKPASSPSPATPPTARSPCPASPTAPASPVRCSAAWPTTASTST